MPAAPSDLQQDPDLVDALRRTGGLLGVSHPLWQRGQDAEQRCTRSEAGFGLVREPESPIQQAEEHDQRGRQPATGNYARGRVLLTDVLERHRRHVRQFHDFDAVVGQ
jgi:hypothetical protein